MASLTLACWASALLLKLHPHLFGFILFLKQGLATFLPGLALNERSSCLHLLLLHFSLIQKTPFTWLTWKPVASVTSENLLQSQQKTLQGDRRGLTKIILVLSHNNLKPVL
jgi:hypothetical protein